LERDVVIGPGAVIGPDVELGDEVEVGAYTIIDGHTRIGARCRISSHTVIGTAPQDLKYAGEPTRVTIGEENVIREFVTINRGTAGGGGETRIGDRNLIMAYCHVAHDCHVGNEVVLANAATLAGHVTVMDHAVIGGLSGFHQFTRVGCYAIVGGCSAVSQDVVPYSMAVGNRARLRGINAVGLRRHGFSAGAIAAIKRVVTELIRSEMNTRALVAWMEEFAGDHPEIAEMVAFIRGSRRGICRGEARNRS